MKKLMIAAAIVCAAAFAQAANWNWSTSGTPANQVWYDNSTSVTLAEGTSVYLFMVVTGDSAFNQSTLLTGIRDGSITGLGAAGAKMTSSINSDSKLTAASITSPGITGAQKFFMAAQDAAGNIFLSDAIEVTAQATADTTIAFSKPKTQTQVSFTSDPTKSFTSGGWYAAAPEPTSGLLLLLGMAGLALKRKRA